MRWASALLLFNGYIRLYEDSLAISIAMEQKPILITLIKFEIIRDADK